MTPLLSAAKTVASSKPFMAIQEGRAFESKVRTLIETRICKSKPRIKEKSQASEDSVELGDELIELLKSCARSSIPSLRQLAIACILSVIRLSSLTQGSMTSRVVDLLKDLSEDYFSKKKGQANSRLFDEVILRYPEMAAVALSGSLVSSMMQAKTPYLRTEAFRLFSSLLKKRKTLQSSGLDQIFSNLESAIQAIASCISNEATIETKSYKPKHYETIMACSKDIAQFMLESKEGRTCSTSASQLYAVMTKVEETDLKESLKKAAASTAQLLEPLRIDEGFLRNEHHDKKRKAEKALVSAEAKKSTKRKSERENS